MGFFDRLRSNRLDYPALEGTSLAADRIEKIRTQLESLTKQIRKPLEVVPGEEDTFVFIGKPPKDFGVAWIEDGEIHNYKTLANEAGLSPRDLEAISQRLREAYEKNQDDQRFVTKIGNKDIVVTPSDQLRSQVSEIIHNPPN